MKLTSWLLRNLSNDDYSTDMVEFVLIASVMVLGVVATCATLTERIGMEFNTIASHL
jgi:Flp pilus assembly pilin Flp